jgi:hypothetical protein
MSPIATTAVSVIVAGLIVAWIIYANLRNRRRMTRLAKALGAVPSGSGGKGEYGGIEYRFTFSPASRYRPSALRVSLDSPMRAPFEVRRQDRPLPRKSTGLALELRSRDAGPDPSFETDAESPVHAFLQSDDVRAAIQSIFGLGFTRVRQSGQRLESVWSPFKPTDDIDPSLITGTVESLAAIARNLPMASPMTPAPRRFTVKGLHAFGVVLVAVLFGLSLATLRYRPLDPGALMRDSLHYSIPALLLWLGVVFVFLRGERPTRTRRQLVLLAFLSVVAFAIGGDALEMITNGYSDAGAPSAHEAQVIGKYSTGGRSTTYHLYVTSWRRPRQRENLVVSRDAYGRARLRGGITVVTKPGRLGYEWVVHYALH